MTVSLPYSMNTQRFRPGESGLFEATLNGTGYTIWSLDEISREFVDFSASMPSQPVLDVGSGFGVATLAALRRGATVIANDCEPRHLDVLWSRTPMDLRSRLTLRPAEFPDGLEFASGSLAAVLISRVFHFFDGPRIERSVQRLREWLRPDGKVFVICDASVFLDERPLREQYERQLAEGLQWPGFVDDVHRLLPHKAGRIPDHLHYLDVRTLATAFDAAGFYVEHVTRFRRFAELSDERLRKRVCLGLVARNP